MPPGLAFFDMDGTLVAGDCGVLFVRHCIARRLLPAGELLGWGGWLLKVAARGLHEREVAQAKQLLLRARVRLGEAESDALYDRFFRDQIRPRIRADCRRELERAQGEGKVYLVTANLRAMAQRLGAELGLDAADCLGAEPLLGASGLPTAQVRLPIPMDLERARLVRELAAQAQVPLAQVRAYGDSLHDVPMLRAVGRPCAVHPRRSLRRIAEREGWRLLAAGPPGR